MNPDLRTGDEIILPSGEVRRILDTNFIPDGAHQLLTKNATGEYELFWIMEDLGNDSFDVQDSDNEDILILVVRHREPEMSGAMWRFLDTFAEGSVIEAKIEGGAIRPFRLIGANRQTDEVLLMSETDSPYSKGCWTLWDLTAAGAYFDLRESNYTGDYEPDRLLIAPPGFASQSC